MKKLLIAIGIAGLCACGSGDTREGYADTTNVYNDIGPTDSATSALAGDRGHPDSTVQTNSPENRPVDPNAPMPDAAGNEQEQSR